MDGEGDSLTSGDETGPADGPESATAAKPGADAAEQRREALEKAAREAATHDDILKHFAENAVEPGEAERFDALRKENGTEGFADQLREAAGGKGDGEALAEDLEGFADALKQERERRRQSKLDTLTKARDSVTELRQQAQTRKEAARRLKEEAQAGGSGFSFTAPKPAKTAPDAEGANGEGFAGATREVGEQLASLQDAQLSRIAEELEKDVPDFEKIAPLTAAERRLADLIADLTGLARGDDSNRNVPPAFRRAVEDYYRALSDDFGDAAGQP